MSYQKDAIFVFGWLNVKKKKKKILIVIKVLYTLHTYFLYGVFLFVLIGLIVVTDLHSFKIYK